VGDLGERQPVIVHAVHQGVHHLMHRGALGVVGDDLGGARQCDGGLIAAVAVQDAVGIEPRPGASGQP
jgi:hypothetical protein